MHRTLCDFDIRNIDRMAWHGTTRAAAAQAAAALAVAPETLGWWPSDLAILAVDGVHAATGMPYWATIVAITLGIRTAILPIGLLAARNGARTAAMKPEMDALQEAIKVTVAARRLLAIVA